MWSRDNGLKKEIWATTVALSLWKNAICFISPQSHTLTSIHLYCLLLCCCMSPYQGCYWSTSWTDQTLSTVHKTCFELEWNSKAFTQTFLSQRRFMSACPACSTALCSLIRGETRGANPSISERYEPQKPVLTAEPLGFSRPSDTCGYMELTGRGILCSAHRNHFLLHSLLCFYILHWSHSKILLFFYSASIRVLQCPPCWSVFLSAEAKYSWLLLQSPTG